jgi:hypothetical protein
MNALPIVLCLAAGLGGGVAGALFVSGTASTPSGSESVSLVPETVEAGPSSDAQARAEIEALRLELASLRSSMEAMRGEMNRESVVSEVVAANSDPETTAEEAAANLSRLSEQDKEAVFALVEEAREVRRQEQAAEREVRMNEWTLERATQIADELGLAAGSEQRIGEIMLERNVKFTAMRNELNDLGWGRETRDLMREQAAVINEWQTEALTTSFGAETAAQIQELAGDGRGRGRGGFGGGGR